MKRLTLKIQAALACLLAPVRTMANALDHKAMLYKLLGCADDADETMVNSRFEEAMKAEPDEADKKLAEKAKAKEDEAKAANEKASAAEAAKAGAESKLKEQETAMANEKAAKDKAEADLKAEQAKGAKANEDFANERKERVKLLLDAATVSGKITKAERPAFEADFANAETFGAALKKLEEKKGTLLPTQRQAGMANIGKRQVTATPEDNKRREQIAQFVNEESAKPLYRHLPDSEKYSQAFTAVMAAHPELSAQNK